ncbi:hypothetical protein JW921_01500 [Candidatus Fermentibacterales bacterium]|nr:hypothetical protein [Candidatus Fermentibacterales bacterium]
MGCGLLLAVLLALPGSMARGRGGTIAATGAHDPYRDYTITITPVVSHQVSFTDEVLGMSFDDTGWPRILCVSGLDDMLYSLEPLTADSLDALALAEPNDECWGVAWLDEVLVYTNDCSDTWLYWYDSSEWFTDENGAGSDGRGMDYDSDLFWQAVNEGALHSVVSWDPMSGIWTWSDISAWVPGDLSGLTAFARDTSSYVCVTTFDAADIWVFRTEDREIAEYIGSASLPAPATSSHGLCYSDYFDSFWWSYESGGGNYIYQFDMHIELTAIEGTTWGGIKARFQEAALGLPR